MNKCSPAIRNISAPRTSTRLRNYLSEPYCMRNNKTLHDKRFMYKIVCRLQIDNQHAIITALFSLETLRGDFEV